MHELLIIPAAILIAGANPQHPMDLSAQEQIEIERQSDQEFYGMNNLEVLDDGYAAPRYIIPQEEDVRVQYNQPVISIIEEREFNDL